MNDYYRDDTMLTFYRIFQEKFKEASSMDSGVLLSFYMGMERGGGFGKNGLDWKETKNSGNDRESV